jgi:hypothetical protein
MSSLEGGERQARLVGGEPVRRRFYQCLRLFPVVKLDDQGRIEKDGEHEHCADAASYGVWNVMGLDFSAASVGENRVHVGPTSPSAQPQPIQRPTANTFPGADAGIWLPPGPRF